MDSAQSRSLIRETFTQPFQKGRFQRFIRELLNNIDESKATVWNKTYVKDAFKPRIHRYERLATYVDPSGEALDILVVHLKKESSLERARTSLRNFAADYLATRGYKEAALVAFVSPTEADWRFSFVKMEYESAADESGNVNVSEKLTPARRYSFLVGANEHSHTAQKQFLPLLENDDYNPTLSEIEAAFDIEKVTKEFFQRYKDLFEKVRDALDTIVRRDKVIRSDFEAKGIGTDDFAKKLLGQIVFLYFLQKKGWFGVERGAGWGSGNRQFLRYLFEHRGKLRARQDRSASRSVNFFNEVLEHLFYDALARERDDDYYARFDCRIPFLNGGLFEPLFGYDWVNTEILLPDELFSNSESTTEGDRGTGILDVFDRFNFTVNEAEPLEKDVAVDPEMLGKVFENLLPENLRHRIATYYTPRPIVGYMCQQTLINYLSTHLPDVLREDVETFIHIGYAQAEFEAVGTKEHKDRFLPESISRNAKQIDQLLRDVTVCDPAIGSGAFPVGMMQEIVRGRQALAALQGMPEQSAYELKRHAIQNSLYGVDIDPGAVEIAKLRLWLSLVVDEDERERIQALPNLDYRIMQGNSLLEEFAGVKLLDQELLGRVFVDIEAHIGTINREINELERQATRVGTKEGRKSPIVVKLEREITELRKQRDALYRKADAPSEQGTFHDLASEARSKLDELKRLHRRFFDEASAQKKKALRDQIDQVEWQFMEATLKERGETEALQELGRHRRDNRRDYFLWKLHFVEVFQSTGGFDVVIANPPYIDSERMSNESPGLRRAIQASYSMTKGNWDIYIAFYERSFGLLGTQGALSFITPDKWISKPFGDELRLRTTEKIFSILEAGRSVFESVNVDAIVTVFAQTPQPFLQIYDYADSEIRLKRVISKDTLKPPYAYDWLFSDFVELLAKIDALPGKLIDLGTCENACATSDAYRLKPFIGEEPKRTKLDEYLQIINTGTIGKYTSKWGLREMVYLGDRYARPVVNKKEFLKTFQNTYGKKSVKPKLIMKGLNLLDVCLDASGNIIPGKTTLMITADHPNVLKLILAVLNSSLAFFYVKEKYPASSYNKGTTFTKDMINDLPIPSISSDDRARIVSVIDSILVAKEDNPQADTKDLESEIDRLVYELYDFTDDEIAIVEGKS